MDQPPGAPPPPAGGAPDWGEMKGKLAAARGPDRLLLIAGGLFVIASFLPWYRVSIAGLGSASENAWGLGGLGVLAALLGVAAVGLAVAELAGAVRPSPSTGLLALVLAGGTLLFTLLRLLFKPGGDAAALTLGVVKITRGIGLWAGIVLAALMTYAAYQRYSAKAS